MSMITKQEFDHAAQQVRQNLPKSLSTMIHYKNFVQREALNVATTQELEDVRDSRINQSLIEKLVRLAKQEWLLSGDAKSLYCVAMAVATIVKEYDWGMEYLVGEGLWSMANRIQNA